MPCHEVAGTRRAPVPGPKASPALRPPRAPGPPRAGASAKRKPRRSRPPLQPLSLSAAEALSLGLPAASPAPAPGPQGKASDTERSFGSFSLFQMRASTSSASTPLRLDGCTAGEHGSNWLLLALHPRPAPGPGHKPRIRAFLARFRFFRALASWRASAAAAGTSRSTCSERGGSCQSPFDTSPALLFKFLPKLFLLGRRA